MQFIFKPALLSSESEAEFKALCQEICKEIPPAGIVEKIYTHRFAVITSSARPSMLRTRPDTRAR